jgi:hypothetical protein
MSSNHSGQKQPVCKKYLAGKCTGKNCKYFHPSNINEIKPPRTHTTNRTNISHSSPIDNHTAIKYIPYEDFYKTKMENIMTQYTAYTNALYTVGMELQSRASGTPDPRNSHPLGPGLDLSVDGTVSNPINTNILDNVDTGHETAPGHWDSSSVTTMYPNHDPMQIIQETAVVNIISHPVLEDVINPVPEAEYNIQEEYITFGKALKTNSITKASFDKQAFITWLDETLPAEVKCSEIVDLLLKITKKKKVDILKYAADANYYAHETAMLFVNAKTNQDWLKELQIRFLDVTSYDGIKSFTMSRVKELLTFTLIQLFIKSNNQDLEDIDKLVALYVCIMRIISKKRIAVEIDDYDIIISKYASRTYEMWYNKAKDITSTGCTDY